MIMLAITLLIALAALTIEASAQQRTIYANGGRVVGYVTTDSQGTTTLYGREGRVISRAAGNATMIHDGVSGQVVGDKARRGRR